MVPSDNRFLRPSASLVHYYGDSVRKLFLAGGLLMLLALPFFNQYLPVPALLSLLAILALSILAGLTNPLQRWVILLDVVVSLVALISFEYHAISEYSSIPMILFGIDQVLAVIFFFAVYFSAKSWRGLRAGS